MTDHPTTEGYDVVGDVHGMADLLVALLSKLGYAERDGVWRHPARRVVFVGDLIDRGARQIESVRIARSMVEAGTAHIVAGNHEFNAVAFATEDPAAPGQHLRQHSSKNCNQHKEFLDQVGRRTPVRTEMIEWFKTLPLWLDLDGLRVVHACWDTKAMADLAHLPGDGDTLTSELVEAASRKHTREWQAIEHLLKGPEVPIPVPYLDKDGHERDRARFAWWDPAATTLDRGCVIPSTVTALGGGEYPPLPDAPIDPPVQPYADTVPLFYGHYWESGTLSRSGAYTACVDYSACKGGPLVAYRWSGESELDDANFVGAPW